MKTTTYILMYMIPATAFAAQAHGPQDRTRRATALAGGEYAMPSYTIDSGAGTATGGAYALHGTIGQAEAEALTGGGYALASGFWQPADDGGGGDCTAIADCADLDGDGVRDDNCVWWACNGGTCAGSSIDFADMGGQFGQCAPDGTADGNDRFHALNCFANQNADGSAPYNCEVAAPTALNVDAGGPFGDCSPDGVCDGNDAFHALNAFDGSSLCTCAAEPLPELPPVIRGTAEIELRATRRSLRAGEVVNVHVILTTALDDLRGYQLHLGARGGRTGSLVPVDIAVAPRKGAPFAEDTPWQAFNLGTTQMVAGLDGPGIAVPAGAYLATFTFRATENAEGEFIIELRHDHDNPDHRTYLFGTRADHMVIVSYARSAHVVVNRAED